MLEGHHSEALRVVTGVNAVTTSPSMLLGADPSRRWFAIKAAPREYLYVSFGPNLNSSNSYLLEPGESLEVSVHEDGKLAQMDIYVSTYWTNINVRWQFATAEGPEA